MPRCPVASSASRRTFAGTGAPTASSGAPTVRSVSARIERPSAGQPFPGGGAVTSPPGPQSLCRAPQCRSRPAADPNGGSHLAWCCPHAVPHRVSTQEHAADCAYRGTPRRSPGARLARGLRVGAAADCRARRSRSRRTRRGSTHCCGSNGRGRSSSDCLCTWSARPGSSRASADATRPRIPAAEALNPDAHHRKDVRCQAIDERCSSQ